MSEKSNKFPSWAFEITKNEPRNDEGWEGWEILNETKTVKLWDCQEMKTVKTSTIAEKITA
jgi:hypothetical protein